MSLTEEVLRRLRSPDYPRRAVVRTLPGGGVQRAVAQFLLEVSARGLVLIVVPSLMLVEQWAARLADEGAEVRVLHSAADALELRSLTGVVRPHIIVSTFARATHGQARAALSDRHFELVVYDGVAGQMPETVVAVTDSASRSVALVSGTRPIAWEGSVTLLTLTEGDFDEAARGVCIRTFEFDDRLGPAAVLGEARDLLARYLTDFRGNSAPVTSAALVHEWLLKLATGALVAGKPSSADDKAAAWRLIDALESTSHVDPRLLALDRVLRSHKDTKKWVVTVLARADAAYVADHLETHGMSVQVFTSETPFAERESLLSRDIQVVVATGSVLTSLQRWPDEYGAVWWTPPRTRAEYEERLDLIATGGRVQVVQLVGRGAR